MKRTPSRSASKTYKRTVTSGLGQTVHLERALGFTVQSNASVALDVNSGLVAYPAGCLIVLFNTRRNKQSFIRNTENKAITAICFSRDGKFIATGECGYRPMVRVWSVEERCQLSCYAGHNFRIECVQFSPSGQYLVSAGSPEDHSIHVWDVRAQTRLASSNITSKINALAFSEDGQFFVTVGVRSVRFWYMDTSKAKLKEAIPLQGRNAILREFIHSIFTDVACCVEGHNPTSSSGTSEVGQTFTYALTQDGQLCKFNAQRNLLKWVNFKTPRASSLSLTEQCIVVGCARGYCIAFHTASLNYITRLPFPHALGVDVAAGSGGGGGGGTGGCDTDDDSVFTTHRQEGATYPDIVAARYDHRHSRVICFFNDHSLYVWDIRDIKHIQKHVSHMFHSGPVWSVQVLTTSNEAEGNEQQKYSSSSTSTNSCLLVTGGDDDTLRIWDLPPITSNGDTSTSTTKPNPYSKDLKKIIYLDPYLTHLTDSDKVHSGVDSVRSGFDAEVSNVVNDSSNSELKPGVRAIDISHDSRHLAAGDKEGNIRVFLLDEFEELMNISAHDGEVLCVSYFQSTSMPDLQLLCSSSRDRLIHVFDVSANYCLVQTLDDHSGAVHAVNIVETSDGSIRLLSCGVDKSFLFHLLKPDERTGSARFTLAHHLVGKNSQHDLCVTHRHNELKTQMLVSVACQDRYVRVYNVLNGKLRRTIRGSRADDGILLRCALDPSDSFLATTGSDKEIYIVDFRTGEMKAQFGGHSEIILGLKFLPDLRRLISVSADGCIFIWRLPSDMSAHMRSQCHAYQISSPVVSTLVMSSTPASASAPTPAPTPAPSYPPQSSILLPTDYTPPPPPTIPSLPSTPTLLLQMETNMEKSSLCKSDAEMKPANDVELRDSTTLKPLARDNSHQSFRFSVSALPQWAKKNFDRRESFGFGLGGVSLPNSSDADSEIVPLSSKAEVVPKVVAEDDPDNLEDDLDESRFTHSSECAMEVESLRTLSTGEDDEEEIPIEPIVPLCKGGVGIPLHTPVMTKSMSAAHMATPNMQAVLDQLSISTHVHLTSKMRSVSQSHLSSSNSRGSFPEVDDNSLYDPPLPPPQPQPQPLQHNNHHHHHPNQSSSGNSSDDDEAVLSTRTTDLMSSSAPSVFLKKPSSSSSKLKKQSTFILSEEDSSAELATPRDGNASSGKTTGRSSISSRYVSKQQVRSGSIPTPLVRPSPSQSTENLNKARRASLTRAAQETRRRLRNMEEKKPKNSSTPQSSARSINARNSTNSASQIKSNQTAGGPLSSREKSKAMNSVNRTVKSKDVERSIATTNRNAPGGGGGGGVANQDSHAESLKSSIISIPSNVAVVAAAQSSIMQTSSTTGTIARGKSDGVSHRQTWINKRDGMKTCPVDLIAYQQAKKITQQSQNQRQSLPTTTTTTTSATTTTTTMMTTTTSTASSTVSINSKDSNLFPASHQLVLEARELIRSQSIESKSPSPQTPRTIIDEEFNLKGDNQYSQQSTTGTTTTETNKSDQSYWDVFFEELEKRKAVVEIKTLGSGGGGSGERNKMDNLNKEHVIDADSDEESISSTVTHPTDNSRNILTEMLTIHQHHQPHGQGGTGTTSAQNEANSQFSRKETTSTSTTQGSASGGTMATPTLGGGGGGGGSSVDVCHSLHEVANHLTHLVDHINHCQQNGVPAIESSSDFDKAKLIILQEVEPQLILLKSQLGLSISTHLLGREHVDCLIRELTEQLRESLSEENNASLMTNFRRESLQPDME